MIYNFNEKSIPSLSQVGGKAKALIETTRAGFPVPEGIVLSVEFFMPWLETVKASLAFQNAMDDTTKENCDIVKELASSLTFNKTQKEHFENGFLKLDGGLFAVRSSSPEEDLEGTSFAGMYETYLGIKRETVIQTVALAFSSCFDFRVMQYKQQNGLDLQNTSIAIIIQRQIRSDVSGVGFSLNPLNNAYDEVLINASFGLGEAIVSGIVTPDSYVYDWAENKIIDKKISTKQIALWLNEHGGLEEKQNENQGEQALTDEQIVELATLIKKCESHYGKPMDTEWAFENSRLYLLQSRPITTHFHLFEELQTAPNDPKKFYIDVMMMTQGFGEPMSVLGLDLWSKMLYDLKMGMFSPEANGTAPAIYGKEYFSVTAISKIIGRKSTQKFLNSYDRNIKKIFDEIDLNSNKLKDTPEGISNVKIKMGKTAFTMLPNVVKSIIFDHTSVVNAYLQTTKEIISTVKALKKEEDFYKSSTTALYMMQRVMGTASIIFAGMMGKMTLNKLFKGMDVAADVVTMGMDLTGNPTSQMGHLLFKMANTDDFKQTVSKEDFCKKAKERLYSKSFLVLYDEFMEKYAVRGFKEIDIASKRIYEDIGMLYDKLIEINVEDNQILKVAEKREKAYQKLLKVAKEKGFEKKFIKAATKYRETFGYREHPKYIIVYIFAMLHNICLELADEWVAEGRLDDRNHIFDLYAKDISKAQKDTSFNMRTAREKNLSGYKKIANVKDFPLVIDSRGKIYKPKMEIKDGDMIGDPIAAGKVIGKAKVLHSPYEKPLLSGEILIARATEPSWTPIFTNAAGVVMEIGGPLQHGGIIAREYGIPCVSGLIGIMDIVKDGDLLEIDGSNGIVKIL